MSRRSQWQQDDTDETDECGNPCSRGDWCAGRRIIVENGERVIIPARTYSAFCPACRTLISSCLRELPEAYARLAAEIGEPVRRNSAVLDGTFGPRLPLRADVDDVMRSIEAVLQSWEERVRDIAHLSILDTGTSRRRDAAKAVTQSVTILSPRLDVLFALESGPVMRSVAAGKDQPDHVTLCDLGGQDAGEEILALHRRSLLILGEVARRPETLDGVPCKKTDCMAMSLERAEPPSDPAREAMWSRCAACGAEMSKKDFDAWAKWYSTWADSSGISCRMCQLDHHGKCRWEACACRKQGHAAASCA